MKLIDCTISAFGALTNRHIDFNEDITCILEENGFGKTTLAAFIKAMFYSLPTARKNQSADSSERAKYYPWGGGNFGGRLTFEANGKQYRIIRSFDRYSITADRFELIDAKTGLPSSDFDQDIGQQLFGVDEGGFMRTTFSDGNVRLSGMPVSIRNKISSAAESADDMDDFEKARERLANAIKAIEGKNGILDTSERKTQTARTEMERCKAEMAEHTRLTETIASSDARRKELEAKKKELSALLNAAQGAEAAELKRKNYSRLLEKCEQLKKAVSDIKQKYGGACPEEEKLTELQKAVEEYKEQLIYRSVEDKKQSSQDFKDLEALFENEFPSDEEMGSLGQQIRLIDQYKSAIEQSDKRKSELSAQLLSLGVLNAEQIPDEGELNEIRSLSSRTVLSPAAPQKSSGVIWAILSAVLLLIGIAVCFVHLIAGIAIAAVGAVALIACLLLGSVRKMVSATAVAAPSSEDKRKTEEFLIKFGFSKDADVNSAVDKLKSALSLKEQIENCEQQTQSIGQKLADELKVCWAFMDKFSSERAGEAQDAFAALNRRRERYLNEVLPSRENKDNLEKRLKSLREDISQKFSLIGAADVAPECFESALEEIKGDAEAFEQLSSELEKTQMEAKESYERDDIGALPAPADIPAPEDITNSLSLIEAEISQLANDIANLRLQTERLSESRQRYNELEELVEAEKETREQSSVRLKNLKLAAQFLQGAKDELSQKYSAGINQSFAKYSSLFLDAAAKDAQISGELTLSVEREGAGRIPEFFSSGQKSVMDVCLRLSLIDAMFEKEKPFLILDDPFVSLDEQNLQSALTLLKEVCPKLQIVYLTCHQSRAI